MKKLLLLLLCVPLIGVGQERYHIDNVKFSEDSTTVYFKNTMKPITGVIFNTYENGKLKKENKVINGKRNGISKGYYENGKLKIVSVFVDGELNGLTKAYQKNGKLGMKGNFQDGKPQGLWRIYHENGRIKSKSIFKDGKVDEGECWDKEGNEIDCE